MRTAIALLASLAALTVAAPVASAELRPLPEIQCGFAGCPDPVGGVKECVTNGAAALVDTLQGTPQPQTCDPMGRTSTERTALRPPPPHCDPMACPNPVEGAKDCLETLAIGEDPETGETRVYGDCDLRGY